MNARLETLDKGHAAGRFLLVIILLMSMAPPVRAEMYRDTRAVARGQRDESLVPPMPSDFQNDDDPTPAPIVPKRLADINLSIRLPKDQVPEDYAAKVFAEKGRSYQGMGGHRGWLATEKQWQAPAVPHRPAYFEDPNLERYGYSWGCAQPAVSAVRFVGQSALLPYQVVHDHPHACRYDLGYERPGSCVPYRTYREPIDLHAGAAEAATIAGLILLIP